MLNRNLFFQILTYLSFLVFIAGCDLQDSPAPVPGEQFEPAGLNGISVNNFIVDNTRLYAATNDGIWSTNLNNDVAEWENEGLSGLNVIDVVILQDGSFLAGIQRDDIQSEEPVLFFRDVFAEEWAAYQSDFGGPQNYNYINALTRHPDQPEVLFARGSFNVAKSTDGGTNWRSVFEDWDNIGYQADLLEVDPHDSDRIWVGGESSIFQPYLYYSNDQGENWNGLEIDASGDNAVYSMAFHPEDEDQLLIGIEGAIWSSNNRGQDWEVSHENDLYHYILTMATPNNEISETVFATGTEHGAQGGNIFFLMTTDFGGSWEKRSADHQLDGVSISALEVREIPGETTIYLGTSIGVWMYRM